MKRIFLIIILLSASAFGQSFVGRVVAISDADTISVAHSDGNVDRVRFLGIDAPEKAKSSKEIAQPFADKCRQILTDLIGGKSVFVETSRRDSYGRNLARILLNEIDANLTMLTLGCAHLYYPNNIPSDLRGKYEAAFIYARDNKVGLFAAKKITTPANWRARKHLKPKKKVKK